MRFEARTNEKATTLLFTDELGQESISIRHADLVKLTVPEAIRLLSRKVEELLPPVDGFVELYGDEDDADLSLFEELVEVDW